MSIFYLPGRTIFYQATPSGEKPKEGPKTEKSGAVEVDKASVEKKGEAIVGSALRRIDASRELELTKNYQSMDAAEGFMGYWINQLSNEIRDQSSYELGQLAKVQWRLKYDATHETHGGSTADKLPDIKGLRRMTEEFIAAYNKMVAGLERKILVASKAPEIKKLKPADLQYETIDDPKKCELFIYASIDELPIEFLNRKLYEFTRDLRLEGFLLREKTSRDERKEILEKFIAEYNRNVDIANSKITALKNWAKQNPAKLARIPYTAPPKPKPQLAAAETLTGEGEEGGSSERETIEVPKDPKQDALSRLEVLFKKVPTNDANSRALKAFKLGIAAATQEQYPSVISQAEMYASQQIPTEAKPAVEASTENQETKKVARITKFPTDWRIFREEHIVAVDAALAATERLLKKTTGHGIGNKGLTMDDIKRAVKFKSLTEADAIAAGAKGSLAVLNKRKLAADIAAFQHTVGAYADGRFGSDTFKAAVAYVKKNNDTAIANALKITLEAPTVAAAPAAAPAEALIPEPKAPDIPKITAEKPPFREIVTEYKFFTLTDTSLIPNLATPTVYEIEQHGDKVRIACVTKTTDKDKGVEKIGLRDQEVPSSALRPLAFSIDADKNAIFAFGTDYWDGIFRAQGKEKMEADLQDINKNKGSYAIYTIDNLLTQNPHYEVTLKPETQVLKFAQYQRNIQGTPPETVGKAIYLGKSPDKNFVFVQSVDEKYRGWVPTKQIEGGKIAVRPEKKQPEAATAVASTK